MLGGVVTPDVSIQDVSAADVDAVLLVGGTGASALWHNAAVHTLVKKLVQTGGVVGALCLAPVTLPNAGLLEGRAATAFPSAGDFLAWRGATYTGKAVEQSDTIITANGPDAAEELARLIARALAREGLSCPGRSRRTGESSLRSND
jgi:putative intracellular protease/amidase